MQSDRYSTNYYPYRWLLQLECIEDKMPDAEEHEEDIEYGKHGRIVDVKKSHLQ
jgi:hypothetical protein